MWWVLANAQWGYTQWVYGPRLDALLFTIHTTVNTAYNLR